jgi:hypothetical protein
MAQRTSSPARPPQNPVDGPPPASTTSSRWRKSVRIVVGIGAVLLGLLWILQGADVVRIRPVLCVADCEPVTGGSPLWLTIGAVTCLVGLFVASGLRLRRS